MSRKKCVAFIVIIFLFILIGTLGIIFLMQRKEPASQGNKADVTWYDENGEEFILTTADELLGMIKLSNYYNFEGQTIKLGADIVFNEGNAADWGEKAPVQKWYPIKGFAGTFDGQGYTISGMYGYGVDMPMGMFANTKVSCSIKNFKLINSYFQVNGLYPIGSVVANGCGNVEKIYSDAIVTSNGENCGGIIGKANDDGTSVNMGQTMNVINCWFDGEVTLTTHAARFAGGIVGQVYGGRLNMAHCLNSGTISNETNWSSYIYAGGLFGALTYSNYSGTVYLDDSLNVGDVKTIKNSAIGSMAGGTIAKTSMVITDTYATEQSYLTVCGAQKGSHDGGVPMISTEFVTGEDWYRWTTLDYDNYWTVTEDSTPILKCFAEKVIDTSNLEKVYNFDWYQEGVAEHVLYTKEDLYGFALMSYSDSFETQVVKLGADIVVNEGKASDWMNGKTLPERYWLPIGRTPAFQGTFDGNGYTISGLYGKSAAPFVGLFGWSGNYSVIQNVRLTNSCFETTATSSAALGSIVGRLEGIIDTVYSDAIIKSTGGWVGGIAGYKLTDNESSIKNCWYNGTIHMVGDLSKNTGGIMGRLVKGTLDIDNCLFSGFINIGGKLRTANVGGFIGNIAAGTVNLKGSLNSGELKVTESEKVNAIGRVFGQVANSETITIHMENSYFTKKGYSEKYWYYCAGKKPIVTGSVELKEEERILGYDGYRTTGLDFDKYWAVVVKQDSTPILKSFAKKVPSVAGIEKTFDKSWYDESKTAYVIKDRQDLYGLVYLLNSKITFEGKSIQLGNDIAVNTNGVATEWVTGKNTPAYVWEPIGKYVAFEGTFDGQGCAISGLYGKTENPLMGLFAWTGDKSIVKNLRITNSCFIAETEGNSGVGSVAGHCEGDVHSVYSDAIIVATGPMNGGIIGYKNASTKSTSTITNCWYDGELSNLGERSKFIGGIAGRVINGTIEIDNCLFSGGIRIGGEKHTANAGGFVGGVTNNLIIKNSLNAGTIELIDANGMNAVGRVIGQIVNEETANVAFDNSYFTREGYNASYWYYCAGNKATIKGGVEIKETADISGYGGYSTTGLDFENYWAVVVNTDDTPVLKSFASVVPSIVVTKTFDKSWYNPDESIYVLNDREDLYGLLYLSNAKINFTGKTIKLGQDIEINTVGTAEEWQEGTATATYEWQPIGRYAAFEGVFDGKKHTISGLFGTTDATYMGLFGWTGTNSEIKNLRLTNTYFESTSTGNAAIGSIAGRMEGDCSNVYSDTILATAGGLNGGIAGYRDSNATSKISNCWYAGTIHMSGDSSKRTGGIIGRVSKGKVIIDNCLFSGIINVGGKTRSSSTGGFVGAVIDEVVIQNSLNSGKFALTDSTSMNSLGRVIGQIESNKNTVVELDNSYYTTVGVNKTVEWYRPKSEGKYLSTVKGVIAKVEEEDICGDKGFFHTELDFTNYWTTVLDDKITTDVDEAGTPVLRNYAAIVNALPLVPDYVDIGWYNRTDKTYTICNHDDNALNVKELYGFAYLVNQGIDFNDKTIYLGNSVSLNEGTVELWKTNHFSGLNEWTPIGTAENLFAGNFDGKMFTISGMFLDTDVAGSGLFGSTASGSNIQNLKVENSYIKSSAFAVGGIVGYGSGNLINVYSHVEISGYRQIGGIVGNTPDEKTNIVMRNCWFAGSISGEYQAGGMIGTTQNEGTIEIENCFNNGSITITKDSVGGLVGYMAGKKTELEMKQTLNMGPISGRNNVGSVMGWQQNGKADISDAVYGITDNDMVGIGTIKTAGNVTGEVKLLTLTELTVSNAVTSAMVQDKLNGLDFKKTWAIGKTNTPVLQWAADLDFDTAWYNTDAVLEIDTEDELYGMTYLSRQGVDFKNQTLELKSDLVFNEKNVDEWKRGSFAELREWTPIGIDTPFAGTFNGNNHSISGIYMDTNMEGSGLFGSTFAGSSIQNLKITNSYLKSSANLIGSIVGNCGGNLTNVYSNAEIVGAKQVGGIVGGINDKDNIVIKNCWFAGQINAEFQTGGIAGMVFNANNVTVENCLNSGSVTTTKDSVGGLIGYTYNANASEQITVKNCLNRGVISGRANVGSTIGWIQKGKVNSQSIYGITDSNLTIVGKNGTSNVLDATSVTLIEITVSSSVTEESVMTELQNLDFKNIWGIGSLNMPELSWVHGLNLDTCWYDESKDSYIIHTQRELFGLASLSESGVTFEGKTIVLGADITINDGTVAEWKNNSFNGLRDWTPIGTKNSPFAGMFNGNSHTISGLYMNTDMEGSGLFGSTIAESSIQNLRVTNSYLETSANLVGSIVGNCGGNLANVYSNAEIVGVKQAGGIVGGINDNDNIVIKNCWFAGQINAEFQTGGIAGMVFNANNVTVENCLNSGSVTTTKDSVGGLIGYAYNVNAAEQITAKNCLNRGVISGRANVGSAVGWVQKGTIHTHSVYAITNDNLSVIGKNDTNNTIDVMSVSSDEIMVRGEVTVEHVKTKLADFDFTYVWTIGNNGTVELNK